MKFKKIIINVLLVFSQSLVFGQNLDINKIISLIQKNWPHTQENQFNKSIQLIEKMKYPDNKTIDQIINICRESKLTINESLDVLVKTIQFHSNLRSLGLSKFESHNKSIMVLEKSIYTYQENIKNNKTINLSEILNSNINESMKENDKKQNKDRMSQEIKRKQAVERYKRKK